MRCILIGMIHVIGGGPAGSSAAIAASLDGAAVELREKSRLPRHKVCGEFLSPEILPLLERLGVDLLAARPARIRRLSMRFGSREKTAALPEPAYGLSRFVFDKLLFDRACEVGNAGPSPAEAEILAHGRQTPTAVQPRGNRLFGFKAHFSGPVSDAIELYFFDAGYVGINAVEGGLTNVCGLATESALRRLDFDYDELLAGVPGLAGRVRPLTREMDWLSTGPLVFANRFAQPPTPNQFYAGDALSFVDPFTGSGMYCAVLTGTLAGECAAEGISPARHIRLCREALGRPFAFATLFRNAITSGWAGRVAPFIPARWLFRLTRPGSRSGVRANG